MYVTSIAVTGDNGATGITIRGGSLQLSVSVLPANATNKKVSWSIQNGTGQASITFAGLVTAVSDGTVTATATANDGTGITGSLDISISGQTLAVTGITVTGAGGSNAITTKGGTLQLDAAITPNNASNKEVTWSIQNGTGQASISNSGLVTAIADGGVTATATAVDGSGISGSLDLTISNQNLPTGAETNSMEVPQINIDKFRMHIRFNTRDKPRDIAVYNLLGILVLDKQVTEDECTLDVSAIPSGIYVIMLREEGKLPVTEKVTKP